MTWWTLPCSAWTEPLFSCGCWSTCPLLSTQAQSTHDQVRTLQAPSRCSPVSPCSSRSHVSALQKISFLSPPSQFLSCWTVSCYSDAVWILGSVARHHTVSLSNLKRVAVYSKTACTLLFWTVVVWSAHRFPFCLLARSTLKTSLAHRLTGCVETQMWAGLRCLRYRL